MDRLSEEKDGIACGATRGARRAIGFSLIELLVVLAIIAILLVLAGSSVRGVMSDQRVGVAAAVWEHRFAEAALESARRNRPVEVRLYRYEFEGQEGWWGYQFLVVAPDGTVGALGGLERFGSGVAVHPEEEFSTVLGLGERVVALPGGLDGESVRAVSFQLKPDGSTNLPKAGGERWSVTLGERQSFEARPGEIGERSRVISINPVTGATRVY
jgi:uncharacterized protein (TIGR02596 family)